MSDRDSIRVDYEKRKAARASAVTVLVTVLAAALVGVGGWFVSTLQDRAVLEVEMTRMRSSLDRVTLDLDEARGRLRAETAATTERLKAIDSRLERIEDVLVKRGR